MASPGSTTPGSANTSTPAGERTTASRNAPCLTSWIDRDLARRPSGLRVRPILLNAQEWPPSGESAFRVVVEVRDLLCGRVRVVGVTAVRAEFETVAGQPSSREGSRACPPPAGRSGGSVRTSARPAGQDDWRSGGQYASSSSSCLPGRRRWVVSQPSPKLRAERPAKSPSRRDRHLRRPRPLQPPDALVAARGPIIGRAPGRRGVQEHD
jgi:hypothetical protein